ncbi:MAG: hypothetical protein GY751_11555 [Bacteroidetes bacterium]|nr:hypothetical protein [Bacteroidota bacterium]
MTAGQSTELAKAIPTNTTFIVKINDIGQLGTALNNRIYGQTVKEQFLIPSLVENHTALSAFLRRTTFEDSVSVIPLLASVHLASAEAMNSIHYYPLSASKKGFSKLLSEHFPGAASQEWNYEGVTFNEILIPEHNTKLTIAYTEGILISSTASFLVEDAVKQLKSSNSLLSDSGFKDVYKKETKGADANIWFPYKNARHWISMFADRNSVEALDMVGNFASWMLLDVYLNEDGLFLSGITSAKKEDRLADLKGEATCSHAMQDHLPFNTAAHFHFSQQTDSAAAELKTIGLSNCWSKVLIEPMNTELADHWVILVPISEASLFDQKRQDREALETLLGRFLFQGKRVHFNKSGDLLAVSSNQKILSNYLDNIKNGQVLAKDQHFTELATQLKANAQSTVYFRTMYLREAFNAVYESSEDADKDFDALRGFNQLAFQFSSQGNIFQTTAYLTYNEDDGGSHTNLAWSAALNNPVLAGPEVIRINKKEEMGVLIQDTDFMLYLLDHAGQEVWKKQLDSKWLGKAYDLQLFEDNSIQIAFNTETNWHLLNDEGSEMAGFPLHFKEHAATGMTLHSGKEGIFVFIPLKNGNLYGYEINGKPLPGWNPQEKMGSLLFAPQILESKGSVYIAAINAQGSAYIWDLKGKRKAKNMFRETFQSDLYLDTKASPFKIKNVRANGELISMSAKAKVGKYRLQTNKITQFKMADVAGNRDPEIILSNGSTIWLYDYTGQLLWKKNHSGTIEIANLGFDGRDNISVYHKSNGKLIVLSAKGNVLIDAPFDVNVRHSLSNKGLLDAGQPALITSGTENEVNCYRLAIPSK